MKTEMYVLRRKDTGEYFKKMTRRPHHQDPIGHPNLSNWTADLGKATTYTLKGIKSMMGNYSWSDSYVGKHQPHCEAVRLKVAVDCVVEL